MRKIKLFKWRDWFYFCIIFKYKLANHIEIIWILRMLRENKKANKHVIMYDVLHDAGYREV